MPMEDREVETAPAQATAAYPRPFLDPGMPQRVRQANGLLHALYAGLCAAAPWTLLQTFSYLLELKSLSYADFLLSPLTLLVGFAGSACFGYWWGATRARVRERSLVVSTLMGVVAGFLLLAFFSELLGLFAGAALAILVASAAQCVTDHALAINSRDQG
jgi:hypothetical protein